MPSTVKQDAKTAYVRAGSRADAGNLKGARESLETARVLGVQLQFIRAAAMKEFEGAFAALVGSRVSGLAISDGTVSRRALGFT